MGGPTDELTLTIMRSLEIDWQWVKHFDPADVTGIAEARSAGRRAGRAMGLKIVTFASDPAKREDGRVVVIVAVNQPASDPEDEKRMEDRSRLIVDQMLKRPGDSPISGP
ncbi:hypothetical protein ACFWBG_23175 [Nocardia salmonicida]|uniref:hypothetical protein n=1 Tax=Nocardia salmonicida TaxID=53431 RepID=UPI00366B7E47